MTDKDRIENAIRHIQTATDVDPWAMEIAVGAMVGLLSEEHKPEITDEQAILHLQSTGWMQNHDREMYESGLREPLADDSGSYDSIISCKDAIVRLPSAQPEPHWIPCSESLPEFDFMDVLVCFHDKRSGCEKDYYFISAYIVHGVWEPTLHVDLTDLEAVAWMPLPEPYREEGD